jgi:nucleoid DNA-binding protein
MQIFVDMQELITSFIVQSKECRLAGIGMFRSITVPAEPDIASKKISPPVFEKLFSGKEEKTSDELVKYIAAKKNSSFDEAFSNIKEWCESTKAKLKNGEEIFFQSLGSLKKESSGNVLFRNQNSMVFFEPIAVERVIHKNSDHKMLVGDKETTSSVMNQYFHVEETEVKRSHWKIISIILLGIVILLLFLYFYQNSFSFFATGNHVKINPQLPPATYTTQ